MALIGGALIEMHKDFDLSDFQKEVCTLADLC